VLTALGILLVIAVSGWSFWPLLGVLRVQDSLVSASPNGAHQIIVRERRYIDRNFRILLVDSQTGAEREVFKSFDQSVSIKRERLVWSDDSSKLALVGDSYFTMPTVAAVLPKGETVFLVYDLDADQLWCNTEYNRGYATITAAQAAAVIGKPLD